MGNWLGLKTPQRRWGQGQNDYSILNHVAQYQLFWRLHISLPLAPADGGLEQSWLRHLPLMTTRPRGLP
jgi:hypothetical protein